jgi:DNA-directed RNA polymerase omega subunit
MVYLGRETLLDKSCNSIYKLVILASKRALEIAEGQPKLVEADASVKPSTVALTEIAGGKIECKKMKPKE